MTTELFKNKIVYHSLPDKDGRCRFTLSWLADYHPGHPLGEHRIAERAQGFFANPLDHGFPMPTAADLHQPARGKP